MSTAATLSEGSTRTRARGAWWLRFMGDTSLRFSRTVVVRLIRPDADVAPGKVEFAQLVLQRLAMHTEDRGGARDIAARFFEAARDVAPLELAAVLAEVGGKWHGQFIACRCFVIGGRIAALRRVHVPARLCARELFGQIAYGQLDQVLAGGRESGGHDRP